MNLTEYLYVDERRLQSYSEQILGPFKYDKVPVWNGGGSLLGPKAEVTQARFQRPLTVHEKVAELLKFLTEHRLLHAYEQGADGQFQSVEVDGDEDETGSDETPKVFATMKFKARRVFIPVKSSRTSIQTKGLTIWIHGYTPATTRKDAPSHVVYLLEDFPKPDGEPWGWSSFSLFAALLKEMNDEFVRTVVGDAYVKTSSADRRWRTWSPLRLLDALGIDIGEERNIDCLCRFRASFLDRWTTGERDEAKSWNERIREPVCYFAYPIFIRDADA